MRELWQVDILRYMVDCLGIPQKSISSEIANLLPGISDDATKINKLLNGKVKKGYEGLQPKSFYNNLIAPELKNKHLKLDYALFDLKKFLQEHDIAFSEPEGLTNNDYKKYMYAVLEAGLPRFKLPKATQNVKKQTFKILIKCPA